jgi:DNA-binding MarR family transcriptional regulator
MAIPQEPVARPALDKVLAAMELFQQRIVALHVPEFTSLDITMAQAKLLYVLTAAGELTMSETAHRLGISISTASGAVDHLVGLGLLARSDDPNNRRQVRVSVTDAGAAILEQMRELSTRQIVALCALVSDDDLQVVEHATRILADAALAVAPTTTTPPSTDSHEPERNR